MIKVYSNDGLYSEVIALVDCLFGQSIYIIDYDCDRVAVIYCGGKIILEYDIDYMAEFPEHYEYCMEYPYIIEILEHVEMEELLPFSQISERQKEMLKKIKNFPSYQSREVWERVLN